MENLKNNKILICPLNWGIGHASRDIFIIKHLLKQNNTIIIGSYGSITSYLKSYFPLIKLIEFPSYTIKYSKKNNHIITLAMQIPKIIFWIFVEHLYLKKVIRENAIEVVISDNRFGLWNKGIHSIFITHQLNIKFPESLKHLKVFLNKINLWFINKYDECWIPDNKDPEKNFSGELSHINKMPDNAKFIGNISRFSEYSENKNIKSKKIDFLFILSGPEPQRTIFEELIISQLEKYSQKAVIIQGRINSCFKYQKKKLTIYSSIDDNYLLVLINSSKSIICRSGYTTIMDLAALQKIALLVPTPGQTEQEYLALIAEKNNLCPYINQNNFSLESAVEKLKYWRRITKN